MPAAQLVKNIRVVDTTAGRALLSEILPKGLSFDAINQDMTKKIISGTINACYRTVGLEGNGRVRRSADVHRLPVRDPRGRVDRRR